MSAHHSVCRERGTPLAAYRRDVVDAARGHGRAQGDCSRCPISIDPIHDGERYLADVNETVFRPASLGQLGLAGSRRQAAFLPARDVHLAKVVRREPHHSSPKSSREHRQMNTGGLCRDEEILCGA